MTDRIRDYEQRVINAAMRLLEASVEEFSPTANEERIRDVKRAAFYLGQAAHNRDLLRRKMPRKARSR